MVIRSTNNIITGLSQECAIWVLNWPSIQSASSCVSAVLATLISAWNCCFDFDDLAIICCKMSCNVTWFSSMLLVIFSASFPEQKTLLFHFVNLSYHNFACLHDDLLTSFCHLALGSTFLVVSIFKHFDGQVSVIVTYSWSRRFELVLNLKLGADVIWEFLNFWYFIWDEGWWSHSIIELVNCWFCLRLYLIQEWWGPFIFCCADNFVWLLTVDLLGWKINWWLFLSFVAHGLFKDVWPVITSTKSVQIFLFDDIEIIHGTINGFFICALSHCLVIEIALANTVWVHVCCRDSKSEASSFVIACSLALFISFTSHYWHNWRRWKRWTSFNATHILGNFHRLDVRLDTEVALLMAVFWANIGSETWAVCWCISWWSTTSWSTIVWLACAWALINSISRTSCLKCREITLSTILYTEWACTSCSKKLG